MSSDFNSSTVSALQPFVDRQELAGAVVLVANSKEILSLESIGYSDVAAKTPMFTDAMFWVASQTKPVTATAVMMLVDEGKVDVEDAVEKYLPEFAGQMVIAEQDEEHCLLKKPSHPITLRNVLNHTSGLPFLTNVEQPFIDGLSLRDAAQMYSLLPLQAEPDTQYVYSNVGINIAGRIVEVVSGMFYESFLQERLFEPLGMTDTTFWPQSEQIERLAKSYKPAREDGGLEETSLHFLQHPLDSPCRFATPGGGLFSTATDMARFCQMILRGGEWGGKRYLSQESVRQMTSRQTPSKMEESYGFGWKVHEHSFGHGGAYSTNMMIDPQRELITVFLVQHAGFPGNGGTSHETWRQSVLSL